MCRNPPARPLHPVSSGITTAALAILILSGCTVAKVDTDRRLHSQMVSCCPNEQALPEPEALKRVHVVELDPETPHFDFGMGLAPFAKLAFEPNAIEALEIRAYPRGSGTLFGGDGTFHYANVQLRFYDAAGAPLAFSPPSGARIDTVGWAGHYALISDVQVPHEAATLLITTDARALGERGDAPHSDAGKMVMVSGLFIWVPGRQKNMKYTLSPYGKVELVTR